MIIIGLGNPGKKFELTRHNVGFFVLDKIQKDWKFPEFAEEKKFKAEVSKDKEIILVKPQTFMNLSGESVKEILNFYKLAPENIIVIHDDIDISLGKFKIATDSSSAGHNGVQNIIDELGTQKFLRLRIGIGKEKINEPEKDGACPLPAIHNFVLQKFSSDEISTIEKLYPEILKTLEKNI